MAEKGESERPTAAGTEQGGTPRPIPASVKPPLPPDDINRLSLERAPTAWLDRWLPKHPKPFLAAVAALSAAAWLVALLLADDRGRFLHSRDWQAQPFYLAVHLVVLRLFVTAYTKHFF